MRWVPWKGIAWTACPRYNSIPGYWLCQSLTIDLGFLTTAPNCCASSRCCWGEFGHFMVRNIRQRQNELAKVNHAFHASRVEIYSHGKSLFNVFSDFYTVEIDYYRLWGCSFGLLYANGWKWPGLFKPHPCSVFAIDHSLRYSFINVPEPQGPP